MSVEEVLGRVVNSVGGTPRAGQQEMAGKVYETLTEAAHLMVQAGTGTGKSFGYLVPAAVWAAETSSRVLVSTATLALQRQIIEHDGPAVLDALANETGVRLEMSILKGWSNFACLKRVNEQGSEPGLPGLVTETGEEVLRARAWALETDTGDRDDLSPGVSELVWRQLSLSKQECEGRDCPFITNCFPERARERAFQSDIIVTNHAMLGVHAAGIDVLPEAEAVIIDEAHELVSRVTNQLTVRVGSSDINRIARMLRSAGKIDSEFLRHGDRLTDSLTDVDGRLRVLSPTTREALAGLARAVKESGVSEQWAKAFQSDIDTLLIEDGGTVWWGRDEALYGAPLDVAHPIASRIFSERGTVLTSATLELGGSFEPIAHQVGFSFPSQGPWDGIDVGSPFDYPAQGILYIAEDMPPPGRDATGTATFDRMGELIGAAGGGALGLFTSMRAAEAAAEYLRGVLDVTIYCQGEDSLPTLVDKFKKDTDACLFGTMSLWQGIDVPGHTSRLVLIDRIPFPRPDDPVSQARTELVGRLGGNGFMTISATHAAVLLAQGAGRLLRRLTDRGVVAIFDSRLVTRGYGGYVRSGIPPLWPTGDIKVVRAALARLAQTDGMEPAEATGSE